MNEIEAIKKRHSVRNYLDKEIEAEKVEKLNSVIDICNKEGNLHIQLLKEAGKVFNRLLSKVMGLGSAPSVIACIGPDDETVEERIGYYGERIVLAAQELGLNTCWAGTFHAGGVNARLEEKERLVIVIAIGYGRDSGKVRKSKTVEQVSSGRANPPDWFRYGVEMALLAPTAVNLQKFEIRLNDDDSVEFIDKGGILHKINMGIVKYHFEVGKNYILRRADNLE